MAYGENLNFIKTVKSKVGKETISLWKPTVYEEAEAIVRSWRCKDVSNIIDSRLSHGRSEALRDTSELFVSRRKRWLLDY